MKLPTFRQRRGQAGERLAKELLLRQGYRIAAANVRFPVGEIDLVAWEGQTLCFIEVRLRSSDRFGSAAESITAAKRTRFLRAVEWYLARARRGPEAAAQAIRFDGVASPTRPATSPRSPSSAAPSTPTRNR